MTSGQEGASQSGPVLVVLAAGESRRFGGGKLATPWYCRPLGSWAVAAALSQGDAPVILVVPPGEAAVLARPRPGLTVVVNPDPAAGQAGSLARGLQAVPASASHALFLLADMPLVTPDILARFVAVARGGASLAALQEGGRLSPPTLVARGLFPELRGLSGDQGARGLLRRHAAEVVEVTPRFPGQAADVDTREDLAGLPAPPCPPLAEALGLGPRGLTVVVGAGGKTSLLARLSAELSGHGRRVLATTTTKVGRPQGRLLLEADPEALVEKLAPELAPGRVVHAAADLVQDGGREKLKGLAPPTIDALWRRGEVEHVLVEADGARGRLIKAPRDREPPVPSAAELVVGVVGLGALGQTLGSRAVFAPQELGRVCGLGPDEALGPEHIRRLVSHPQGLFKNAPPSARRVVFLNGAEGPAAWAAALDLADCGQAAGAEVLAGSLREGWWTRPGPA